MPATLDRIMKKLNEGREYRNVPMFEIREADPGTENECIVEGYATTFGNEYTLYSYSNYEVMESVDAHAFDECDMSDVIMQYNHEGRVFAAVRNGTIELATDDHGLRTRAKLGGTELGRQVYAEIKGQYSTQMSMGFRVKEHEVTETYDHDTGKVTIHRKITKVGKLYDVSVVSIPANGATEISARMFGDGEIARLVEERRKRDARNTNLLNRIRLMEV